MTRRIKNWVEVALAALITCLAYAQHSVTGGLASGLLWGLLVWTWRP